MASFGQLLILVATTLIAGTLSAVSGFGGAAILLPLLVAKFGIRDAIPILTVAQLVGNASRAFFNRKELEWRVVGWFSIGAVPAAVAGGLLFATAPLSTLTRLLGIFLIAIVGYRHVRKHPPRLPLRAFAPLGAISSFLSALLGSIGPLMAPFFLAYGLTKGAYIGTEAMASVVMHLAKLGTYRSASLLNDRSLTIGLFIGAGLIVGSYAGKSIVDRLSERLFIVLVETTLLLAGLQLLIAA